MNPKSAPDTSTVNKIPAPVTREDHWYADLETTCLGYSTESFLGVGDAPDPENQVFTLK